MNSAARYGLYAIIILAAGGAGAMVAAKKRTIERSQAKPPCCQVEESPLQSLKPLFPVPAFSLTERSGQPLSLGDLKGKVWIADFIYTTCPGPCPIMTSRMAGLAKEMPRHPDLRFVSFSVDPEHDTPAVLQKFADRYGADAHWLFATGTRGAIRELSTTGFKLALSTASQPGADGPIVHSTRFSLVDREGIIRGYYDGLDPKALERLRTDAERLLSEKQPETKPAVQPDKTT